MINEDFIYTLKSNFSGSSDYLSGVNDGLYTMLNAIKQKQVTGETPIQEDEKPTREYLKSLGFKELPHLTIMNSLVFDVGRQRTLSIGCLGTPNEMMFILEIDREDSKKVNEAVCPHNWDYDSFLTKEKVESTLRLFGIPVQEHKPESEENESELFEEAYKLIIDCYFSSQVVDVFAEFKKQGFKITKKK